MLMLKVTGTQLIVDQNGTEIRIWENKKSNFVTAASNITPHLHKTN